MKPRRSAWADEVTDAELEGLAPWVEWRIPMRVERISDQAVGYACRYCIARYGLKGADIGSLPKTSDEVLQHIRERHMRQTVPTLSGGDNQGKKDQ